MKFTEPWNDSTASGPLVELQLKVEGFDPVPYVVDVQAASHRTAFALSIRKSGSSVFSNIVAAISEASARTVVDLPGKAFQHNIAHRFWNDREALSRMIWPGNVYIGFRDAPTALFGDSVFRQAAKILLVRDPRDVLVSEYFSNAYSHSLPSKEPSSSIIAKERKTAQTLDLESYVMGRVDALNNTISSYRPLIQSKNLTIIRYEDVIFDKASWMRQIAECFDLELSEQLITDIIKWADIRPDTENPSEFIRRVTPGDYLEKLARETIDTLDDRLDPIWWEVGYDRSHS